MIYNPYPVYTPNSYTAPTPVQQPGASFAQQPTPPQQIGIIWVDGEVGAKAQQLPPGWPANTPLPLWDTNDTLIYLKSSNQMGMPNPLQKLHYTMEDQPMPPHMDRRSATPALMSGEDEHKYVTKDELEQMKDELRNAITEAMQTSPTVTKGGSRKNESAV